MVLDRVMENEDTMIDDIRMNGDRIIGYVLVKGIQ